MMGNLAQPVRFRSAEGRSLHEIASYVSTNSYDGPSETVETGGSSIGTYT